MKINIKSLQKFVKLKVDINQLADLFTEAGLEVEGIEGEVLDIAVPPNRADCLGIKGLAREAAALTGELFDDPAIEPAPEEIADAIDLHVKESSSCPKYLGRIVKGINNKLTTPDWISTTLEAAGINSISPVVDITNYVMLETGQPLHAFDADKVNGGIYVRFAKKDEKITLLDGSFRELHADNLLIADNKRPLAVAGIMGGDDSGVDENTSDIILECAYFDPISIRLTARALGLQTDSSYRFERCIDPCMQQDVLEYATNLLLEIVGGKAGPIVDAEDHNYLPQQRLLNLRVPRLEKILGLEFTSASCGQILTDLGMQVSPAADMHDLTVAVPTFRQDVVREIDLIEEVARINGFDKIPTTTTVGTLEFREQSESEISERLVHNCLLNRGYNEAITYSFIDSELAHEFSDNVSDAWSLTNPISSDMNMMRPSLLPGLVQAVAYNLNRQQERVRIYEIGLRFVGGKNDLQQIKTIAGVCTGNFLPENWAEKDRELDFFDIKQDLSALFKLSGKDKQLEFLAQDEMFLHPGKCAHIISAESKVGVVGALHPALQKSLNLVQPLYVFELDYAAVTTAKITNFMMFSKYPAVRRDLALLVERDLPVGKLEQAIKREIGELLTDIVIFDVYEGKGVSKDQKSMGLGITLQDPERTLNDEEVNGIFNKLVSSLEQEFNAVLR